jgi:CheY-like chemotaxis protein
MSTQVKLLCIDDEENGLKLRKLLFERQRYQVLTAPDGPAAIDIFKVQSIDAVIVDCRMPNWKVEAAHAIIANQSTLRVSWRGDHWAR